MSNISKRDTVRHQQLVPLHQFIGKLNDAKNLLDCWNLLKDELAVIGFDRLLYARKPYATVSNFQNQFNTIILSSYGPKIDSLFVQSRGYLTDTTTLWALDNQGPVSWRMSREKYLNGEMTEAEEKIHLITRDLGLIAGYTYGGPIRNKVRSGFGLCFRPGFEQDAVDDVWKLHAVDITARLDLFDLCAAQFKHVPAGEELDDAQITVLQLAAEGKTINEISDLIGCHRRTVDVRMTNARKKLGAVSTLQAVLIAARQGQVLW